MYYHYIGSVKQVRGEDLNKGDVIGFGQEYRSIAEIKKQGNIVRISFNFKRTQEEWDVDVKKDDKICKLGVHRITGMKG